ncbi:MAG: TonB-dependent receptor [Rhodanobacter sp.]
MILKRNVLALALASVGFCATSAVYAAAPLNDQPASPQTASQNAPGAQDTSTTDDTTKSSAGARAQALKDAKAKDMQAITVTGYNKSVETAVDIQRYADTIQNVVTAADIGGLPDQSIADALTRLPGVTAERIGGEASQINCGGLSGNFIQTTLNGRAQPSTSGTNYVQFDQYPSELINQATVYKSSQASLIEGGVGCTIAMATANPLDAKQEQTVNVDFRGSYNDQASDVYGANSMGYRFSAAWQGKFLDDTLGVGLGFARMVQPHVSEQFVGEAFDGLQTINAAGQQGYPSQGIQVQQNGGSEQRNGYVATLVWKPTDNLQVGADGFFSQYNDGSFGRGFRGQLFDQGQAQITNPVYLSNGAIVGGTVTSNATPSNFGLETTADNYTTRSSVFSGGLNAKWTSGPWTVVADVSASRAVSSQINVDTTADPYSGLGTATPSLMSQSLTYGLNGLNIGSFTVPNPGIYTNLGDMALSRYGVYPYVYHDKNQGLRLETTYELADNPVISAIEGGVYINNHTYNADRSAYVYGSEWGDNPSMGAPLPLNSSNAVNTCWRGDFASFPCFLAINGTAVLAANGITATTPVKSWANNWTYIQSGQVNVKSRDAYLMADIDTNLFDHSVTGNIGVRVVRTSQYSSGLQEVDNNAGVPITDQTGVTSSNYIPVTQGLTYTDWLPSINLVYHFNDADQLRLSAAKTMAPPYISSLLAGHGAWEDSGQYNLWSNTSPLLKPMYANTFDASFEHYFPDSSGAFTAHVYTKHVESFVQQVTYNDFDFASVGITVPIDPSTGKPYLNGQYQTSFNNTQGGTVHGLDLFLQKTHFLPGVWSGLGVSAGFSLAQSAVKSESTISGPPQNQGLPGLSKKSATAALFYDNGTFSAQLSGTYRSSFVSDSQIAVNNQIVYFAPETVFNLQGAYNFTKNFSLLLQFLNLTNQPTRTYFGNTQQTGTIQYFGRTTYLGFNLKF